MAKATHSGECQICGRQQKLPGGHLSLHGYTKQWGFFNGVCPGAGELPLEQSKDLIEPIVETREAQLVSVRVEIEALKAGKLEDGDVAWVNHYYSSRTERGYYQWIKVEIVAEFVKWHDGKSEGGSEGYFNFTYKVGDKTEKLNIDYQSSKSLDDARKSLNCRYAEYSLDKTASQLASYIKWQRERLANWSVKPLSPVPEMASK